MADKDTGYGRRWKKWLAIYAVAGMVIQLIVYLAFFYNGGSSTAGEIELLGDDVGGIAVAIVARLTSLAGADEVVVSSTAMDLVAGPGIRFQDRGIHALKGVPEKWHVFGVQPG